jgi:Fe-S-cluster containining protein
MNIHFECTMCGKCCHNLKLPLSIKEAIVWLDTGGDVQVLCEAIPWPEEPPLDYPEARRKRQRSFAASSGKLPARIIVTVVASFNGPCPHLRTDMRCGNYEQRPRVCRIYPAEINPFVNLTPLEKACPPEAWSPDKPLLMGDLRLVDSHTQDLIEQTRAADIADVECKAALCTALEIDSAALANEGFVIYSPARENMLAALRQAQAASFAGERATQWTLVSNRITTVDTLKSVGAVGALAATSNASAFEYLGFFPSSA